MTRHIITQDGYEMVKCEHCGKLVRVDDTTTVDDEMWCESCVDDDAAWCEHCDDYHRSEGFVTVYVCDWDSRKTGDWCEFCADSDATRCDDCGEYVADDARAYAHHDGSDVVICPSCREDYYYCEACEELYHSDNGYDVDGYWYCDDCAKEREGDLTSYGHSEGVYFKNCGVDDPTPGLYLGVELETEADDGENYELAVKVRDAVERLTGNRELVACKRDGSLADDGCEIVTQPFTPAYHATSGVWDAILGACNSHGASSYDTEGRCGMHVHVSGKYVGYYGRLFIGYAVNAHPEFWRRFAQRSAGGMHYCEFKAVGGAIATVEDAIDRLRSACGYGHYTAVNNSNDATVEVCIFRGTLDRGRIDATLQAVAGLAVLARRVDRAITLDNKAARTVIGDVEDGGAIRLMGAVRAALDSVGLDHAALDAYLARRFSFSF